MMLVFEEDLDFLKEQRRKTFLKNLVDEGVEIEIEHPDPTKRRVIIIYIRMYIVALRHCMLSYLSIGFSSVKE